MKRIFITLLAIAGISANMMAMSTSRVRKETLFLTDKMAYELQLSTNQYNDAYEINYDFIYKIRNLMDDVIDGDDDAQEEYYNYLDVRNDDLRWVLSDRQYRRFMGIDYFYRPIVASGSSWNFRVYTAYPNQVTFYFGKPFNYNSYCGRHYRTYNNNVSYYSNRYNHNIYRGEYRTTVNNVYINNRRSDFGYNERSSSQRTVSDDMYRTSRTSDAAVRSGYDSSNTRSSSVRSSSEGSQSRVSGGSTSRRSSYDGGSRSSSYDSSTRSSSTSTPVQRSSSSESRSSTPTVNTDNSNSRTSSSSSSRSSESTSRSESGSRR